MTLRSPDTILPILNSKENDEIELLFIPSGNQSDTDIDDEDNFDEDDISLANLFLSRAG